MQKIGMIGVGNMGKGICDNLIKKGYDVTVYDANDKALAPFEDRAVLADTAVEVAAASDVIFLSLPNSEVVEHTVDVFLEHGVKDKIIVDVSTSDPTSTKSLYERVKEVGGALLDAPLLGGPADTAAGNAPCMISGDREYVDAVIPIMESYASPIDYFGEIGQAHTVKLAMNFTGLMYAALAAQMFPLMEKMGVDTKYLFEIMSKGPFGNMPFDFYGEKYVNKNYRLDFALELALKDMVYMKRLYERYNVPGFLLDGGLDLLRQAVKEGRGKRDTSEMAAVIYEYLGLNPDPTS